MKILNRLMAAFRKLPGVGPRQAERFAMHYLRASNAEIEELVLSLREMKSSIRMCRQCLTYCDKELCSICDDSSRDKTSICVVEDAQDIDAVEKTGTFRGVYHVLHGAISPVDGVGPDAVRIKELVARIKRANPPVTELIIATDPDTEGEATALYIADLLRNDVPSITRLAYGMPLGGDIDYTDEMTLSFALRGRVKL